MTEAVQEFYSGTRVTIGVTMEHDSYTDISLETVFTVKGLPSNQDEDAGDRLLQCAIRKEDRRHEKAKAAFAAGYKIELGGAISADHDVEVFSQGD
ncbi:hypothetical protein K4K61_012430 [Colletotrichum sp. SAR11_59]|uniref:Uncharacterized protein n=1 Tax=Colletotrichum asianum TaxID=702518 RepID=A0A8H3VYT9_9PEZI|nr:hypothetical protein GQ607_017543 [Colletotrichum asianum]KAI8311258.1 hypothetical protein K4K61_012430 [Colletotrichum sp. SAR11_59]